MTYPWDLHLPTHPPPDDVLIIWIFSLPKWKFEKWREIGGAFELSLAGLSKIVSLNGGMTAGNWRCLLNYPWQVTICQRQSHGMTTVSLCCMPLDNCPFQIFNYPWQDIFIYVAVSVCVPVGMGQVEPSFLAKHSLFERRFNDKIYVAWP